MVALASTPSEKLALAVVKGSMEMAVLFGITAPTILPIYRRTELQSKALAKAARRTTTMF